MAPPTLATDRARLALGAAYATNFAALAASSPFLAVHLGAAGFSAPAIAQLLAAMLLVRVVALPAWTLAADRAGTVGGVLRLVSAGALGAFAILLLDPRRAFVALALLAFAVFRAPFGALLDALTLHHVGDSAAGFGVVRAWGTAGYALGALVTGALVAREGPRGVLYLSTITLAAAFAAACLVRGASAAAKTREERAEWRQVAALLGRPRVLLLFGVALLQEAGLAPYDALFPAYLTRVAGAGVAGVAVTVGAGAELVFLLGGASLARKLGPERLLVIACAASAARWTTIALVTSAPALVAIQLLHSLSFGGFYVSAVLLMDRETPPSLRASGQGLFGSFSFGVAAALGLSLAGVIEKRAGLPVVFAFAAAASVVAAATASFLRPPRESH